MLAVVISFGNTSAEAIAKILTIIQIDYKVIPPDKIPDFTFTHIILSGGPKHVYEPDSYFLPEWVISSPFPVLGICYGMQLVAYTFGGIVVKMSQKEYGCINITQIKNRDNKLLQLTESRWMNRYDEVTYLPEIFHTTAITSKGGIAGFTDYKKWYCVQYHPESDHCGDISLFKTFLT